MWLDGIRKAPHQELTQFGYMSACRAPPHSAVMTMQQRERSKLGSWAGRLAALAGPPRGLPSTWTTWACVPILICERMGLTYLFFTSNHKPNPSKINMYARMMQFIDLQ